MSESLYRLTSFAGVLLVMAAAETFVPRRPLTVSKLKRWTNNIGLGVLNTVLLRLLFPLAAVGVAAVAQAHDWGLFNLAAVTDTVPNWLTVLGSVVVLDFVIYLQHRAFHIIPVFWRFHRVHHADLDLDVSSGMRFHPVEIVLSMGIKMAAVLALGAPPVSVVAFEILLNATSMFNHSNVYLPLGFDRILRWVTVTPDMHRVHHSADVAETNTNFSFNLSFWDRLLGTHCAQPAAGHEAMTIGLAELRCETIEQIPQMLALPFKP